MRGREMFDRGLSPRVWGNLAKAIVESGRWRSIPACAGEPMTGDDQSEDHAVYPRVCGGTSGPAVGYARLGGLSPRVRGNHALFLGNQAVPGSIPACAGEPSAL